MVGTSGLRRLRERRRGRARWSWRSGTPDRAAVLATRSLTFLASYVLNPLIALDGPRAVIGARVIGLLFLSGLAFVLVPRDGAVGAARTLLTAELALAAMYRGPLVRYRRVAASA